MSRKVRPTDMEQLILDYYRDKQKILRTKISWLPADEILKGRTNEKTTNKQRHDRAGKTSKQGHESRDAISHEAQKL